MLKWIKKKYLDFKRLRKRVVKINRTYEVPFLTRIKMYLKGFTADQYVRYDLKNNDINDYISEIGRWQTRNLNGRYNILMDDKILFAEVFGKHVNLAKNLAWIKKGKIYSLCGNYFSNEHLLELLKQEKKVVLKPVYLGGAGKGIHMVKVEDESIYMDEEPIEAANLTNFIKNLDDYLIVEFIKQHEYANKLYDKTTNTIRIITMKNIEGEGYTIPKAVHRIGVKSSIPVDNARRGALVSQIDLETGIMGKAKTYFNETLVTHHPDSRNPIEGVVIPHWREVKKKLLDVANRFPYIHFMAWDIVITEKAFGVVEVNASTSFDLFQMWEGERNEEIGEFYKHHGIIK